MLDLTSDYTQLGLKGTVIAVAILGLFNPTRTQAIPWFGGQQSETDRPPDTAGQSAGSRGCSAAGFNPQVPLNPTLSILTPETGLNYTTLVHPTFAWFTSVRTEHPVEFRVYKYQEEGAVVDLFYSVELDDNSSSPGIKLFSLPPSAPSLSLNQTYIWQVEIICDPMHPSGNLFVESEIFRTEVNPILQAEIQATPLLQDRVEILNQENLWLDALHLSTQPVTSHESISTNYPNTSSIEQTNTRQQQRLEQLAIATHYTELYELSKQFPLYVYTTTP